MSAKGKVLYSASEGCDADVWDDTALIQEYERALESSRELMRCRKVQSSGKKGKGREWKIGDSCRAVFSEDGLEYEGTVVFCNKSTRSVTVRFFGYNNEESVKEKDLMESLGQEEVEAQIEQARLDMEEEEEEEGVGDEYRLGDWCRARWSEDETVYEATVESVDSRRGTATVKFVGFGNCEVKRLEELYMSKGEERRAEQEQLGSPEKLNSIKEEELQNLIIKNCPDLLANFGETSDLDLVSLSLDDEVKEKKKDKKDKKDKKAKKIKSKENEKKEKIKEAAEIKRETEPIPSFGQIPLPNHFPSFQAPFSTSASPFPSLASPFSPFAPPAPLIQSPFSCPPSLPPPPVLPAELETSVGPELHSLLLSWYMAGYHTGLYQGVSQKRSKKK